MWNGLLHMEALPWSPSETDFTILGQELTDSETTHPTWCPRGCLLIELAPVLSPSRAAFRAGLAICCNAKNELIAIVNPTKRLNILTFGWLGPGGRRNIAFAFDKDLPSHELLLLWSPLPPMSPMLPKSPMPTTILFLPLTVLQRSVLSTRPVLYLTSLWHPYIVPLLVPPMFWSGQWMKTV